MIIISYPTRKNGIILLLQTPQNNKTVTMISIIAHKPMMAKSTKSLDLHYPMIQFLKIAALHKKTKKK